MLELKIGEPPAIPEGCAIFPYVGLAADIIVALAWPGLAAFVIYIFRSEIRSLLQRAKSLSGPGDLRIELNHLAESAVDAVPNAGEGSRMAKVGYGGLEPPEFYLLTKQDPAKAIAAVFQTCATHTIQLAQKLGIDVPREHANLTLADLSPIIAELDQRLKDRGSSLELSDILEGLWRIKLLAELDPPDRSTAFEYAALADMYLYGLTIADSELS